MIVKICGITSPAEAQDALEAGADLLGLNFVPGSPRYVELTMAKAIVTALPREAKVIGVLVNPSRQQVLRILESVRLDGIQLHGDETPDLICTFMARLPVIKAVRTRQEAQQALSLDCQLLLDARSPAYGGSGKLADWTLARELSLVTSNLYLAGGLTPDNVADAIRKVRPFGVDVASGVEISPGRKSRPAMKAFVTAARAGECHVKPVD